MANSALDDLNQTFHDSYDGARDEAESDGPIFVLLADTLVVHGPDGRRALSFTPQAFHDIKAVAHAPLALFGLLHRLAGKRLDEGTQASMSKLRHWIARSMAALVSEHGELERSVTDELSAVLRECAAFMDARSPTEAVDGALLEAFARKMGPKLISLTEHATRIQLVALDAHVNRELGAQSEAEQARLQVVVTGDHQARVRSLAMQYFRMRLCEPAGVEERVTYAEGVSDEKEALSLVGKRRLDQTIALTFFGDHRRLQSDILGDAAKKLLDHWSATR